MKTKEIPMDENEKEVAKRKTKENFAMERNENA